MANINRVVISGNLTKDPELRQLPSGNSVCKLRMAVNTRVKDRDSGQWTDRPNYFDVTVWGGQGESVALRHASVPIRRSDWHPGSCVRTLTNTCSIAI